MEDDTAEEHDEGYFASFTDLLVGILFVFIILLMVFASNFNKQTQQTREATEAITGMTESRNKVLEEIQRSLQESGVAVRVDLKQGILRLPESVLFDVGKYELNEGGVDALTKLAHVLNIYVPCLAKTKEPTVATEKTCDQMQLKSRDGLETLLIEGHTDHQGSDTGFDNWGLSARRAISVFQQITHAVPALDHGIVNMQDIPVLAVSGYEARRPVSTTDLKPNRRIDLRFIMRSPTPEDVERLQKKLGN
ncbi:MAG: OmpA family protein [Alphaproteobacteria bacterium]|nr:MAG: OmpA family protein [Alphaproteobacteria bacterium]